MIDSKVRDQYMSMTPGYNVDFGYQKQEARNRQVSEEKKKMTDELDRQIQ